MGVLKPLAEGIFLRQFVELSKSAALIVGKDKADFVTFAIFATGFGLIRPIAAFGAYRGELADQAAVLTQSRSGHSRCFPAVDWQEISSSLDHRLGAAYSQ